ncbi:MAG: hypothetical protein K2H72_02395, partial [Muribaculaceae bacterium]|nr:hypothetical protein [Muribaculaceae bacterium]
MRRFFLILLAMSFLALVLAQPSMRQAARRPDVSAPEQTGEETSQSPEIVATNLPEGDTLIGIKPLDPDTLKAWMTDSLRHTRAIPDSLGGLINETILTDTIVADG